MASRGKSWQLSWEFVERNEIDDVARESLSGIRDGNVRHPVVCAVASHDCIRRGDANGVGHKLRLVAEIRLTVVLKDDFAGHGGLQKGCG
jgi:hypothetical protein